MQQNNNVTELGLHANLWQKLREEAEEMIRNEPDLSGLIHECILNQPNLTEAVICRIASRLDHTVVSRTLIRQLYSQAVSEEPQLAEFIESDVIAVLDRDPVCERYIEPVMYFKGFHSIQTQRLTNWLWRRGRKDFALYIQSRASEVFQIDIHPAVPLGKGLFFDHGTGIVIGATAVIEDNVSILQGVTLGGTGKEGGDRHPKIRQGVLVGAGANVLGNIEIGEGSKIASGSVVLAAVPPHTTVAGVPAKVVGKPRVEEPARAMDHIYGVIDH